MINLIILSLPIAYWFLNRIRGGGYDKIPQGKWVASIATGLIIGLVTMNPLIGLAAGGAYRFGILFSWGQWVGSSPHFFDKSWQETYNQTMIPKRDGRDSGIHFLVSRIFDQRENFTNYCIACLFLRGIWWWAPVYAVLAVGGLSIPIAVAATVAAGIMMPIAYYISGKNYGDKYWGMGEHIYGAMYGIILAIALIL